MPYIIGLVWWPACRVIDRASKKGGRGSSSKGSPSTCSALQSIPDSTFFLGALGVFAVGSLASWGRVYALAMASAGVASRLRAKLFEALMLQEKAFFDKEEPGTLTPVLVEASNNGVGMLWDEMYSTWRRHAKQSKRLSVDVSLVFIVVTPVTVYLCSRCILFRESGSRWAGMLQRYGRR